MGLHRDGSNFGLPEIECETRRRLWWHIMYLDVRGAIAAGLAPLGGSDKSQFDTKMVSEQRDEYIGTSTGNLTPQRSLSPGESPSAPTAGPRSRMSPAMILAVGRYETTIILQKIITRLYGVRPASIHDVLQLGEQVHALKSQLEGRIARIPARGLPELGFIPPNDEQNEDGRRTGDESVFNSWARIMLSMLVDLAFGVLYQPLLKSTKSELWPHFRQW